MKKLQREVNVKSVIERAGTNIKQQIQKSYPFNTQKCKHEHCFICTSNGKGNCHQENITYEIQCGKENCNYIYIGESCRNGMCRGREHLKGIIKKDNESPLYKHLVNEHENYIDKPPCQEFIMNITGTYNKAITRQTRTKQSSDSISTLFTDHLHMIITKILQLFYLFPAHHQVESINSILFISRTSTSQIYLFHFTCIFFSKHHLSNSIYIILFLFPHITDPSIYSI